MSRTSTVSAVTLMLVGAAFLMAPTASAHGCYTSMGDYHHHCGECIPGEYHDHQGQTSGCSTEDTSEPPVWERCGTIWDDAIKSVVCRVLDMVENPPNPRDIDPSDVDPKEIISTS